VYGLIRDFAELYKDEVRRISLLGTSVNRGKGEGLGFTSRISLELPSSDARRKPEDSSPIHRWLAMMVPRT
jgi:hypothetical protein